MLDPNIVHSSAKTMVTIDGHEAAKQPSRAGRRITGKLEIEYAMVHGFRLSFVRPAMEKFLSADGIG